MYTNMLVNGHMEIDEINEGFEVECENALDSATPLASRWYVQFLSGSAQARAQRILWPGKHGPAAAAKITITKPATQVHDLHRIQLYQPVMFDELFAALPADDFSGKDITQRPPLSFRFSIKTNIDIQVGCTINNATATRNWTTNKELTANRWTRIDIPIGPDSGVPWQPDANGRGLYFQIGLSCGPTRLSTLDSVWNDGHYLMIENPTSSTFLMTQDATALITWCSLSIQTPGDRSYLEPPSIARLRTQRYEEKSYNPGTPIASPETNDGAYQFLATTNAAEDRVAFQVTKSEPPRLKIYSPKTGAEGFAYDVTARRDVSAVVIGMSCSHMVIGVPNSEIGHVYRYHWRVTTTV